MTSCTPILIQTSRTRRSHGEEAESFELYVSLIEGLKKSSKITWNAYESIFKLRSNKTFEYVCKQNHDPFGWILNELGAHHYWVCNNSREAFEYFARAAKHNNVCALLNQGRMFRFGDACEKNIEKAIECAEKSLSIQEDNPHAYSLLSIIYLSEPLLCKKKGYWYAFRSLDVELKRGKFEHLSNQVEHALKVRALQELIKEATEQPFLAFLYFAFGYLKEATDEVSAAESFFKAYQMGLQEALKHFGPKGANDVLFKIIESREKERQEWKNLLVFKSFDVNSSIQNEIQSFILEH